MESNGYDIAMRIEALLKTKKLQQKVLADYVGIAPQTFRDWKKRKNVPPASTLLRIAQFLDVSLTYLLTGNSDVASDIPQEVLELAYDIMALDPIVLKTIKLLIAMEKEKDTKQNSEKHSATS